ncbi:hypothetical protein [Sedimentibacter sp. B4]|uniref:hypothetical protein n=1 Tax=Sedimentibacter sp. B4 TaxID=304766 RepID=UPI0002EF510E|nr:hypothetical protein [Sedimentibacter sp. B4]
MKKYIYAMCIFLLIVINFTGCKSINTNTPADVSVDSDEKSNEDSNEDDEDMTEDSNEDKNKDMNEQSTDISENNLIPLEEATPEQLSLININKIINGHQISFNLGDTYISSNSAYFNEYNDFVRNSTKILYCEGYDDKYNTENIQLSIEKEYYNNFQSFETPLTIRQLSPYATFNGYNEASEIIKVESFNFGYDMWQVTFNAFIKRNDDGKTFNIIIDPAYMYGIPVYHDKDDLCKFNINGLNIKADTLEFNCEIDIDMTGQNTKENIDSFNDVDTDYIYATIEADCLLVNYKISPNKTEYLNKGILTKCTPVSGDTTKILTNSTDLDFSAENKDPNMKIIYDLLISNIDTIINEKTVGVVLLDLDFDTFPELLVSRQTSYTDFSGVSQNAVDVEIYRINDNELKYIDTIYNYHRIVGNLSNVIAVKTLDDGSKVWFNMSYKNRQNNKIEDTDYLFTLKEDNLIFTEAFRAEIIKDPDDAEKTITDYYYFGEKMEFEESTEYLEERGDTIPLYTWNGITYAYGRWAFFGYLKQDYCEDMIDSTFNLYSDWIANLAEYDVVSQKELSTRMIHHELAYLVDAYYLGEYSPKTYDYYFEFLGGFAKPVIYLYPEKETEVSINIELDGALTCTYPTYENGWEVIARPDGTLINKDDGREYSYLYWEGIGESSWDMSKGFVVKGADTIQFLQEKLEYVGLTPKELNEFIVYWLPHMQNNKYNLITFQTDIYENSAKLNISPQPDSILRVFMVYKALDEFTEVQEPVLDTFERNGFAVIEWGGTELK